MAMPPPLPTSVTKDIEHLDFSDAVTGHTRLWETYGHDISTFAVNLLVALVILLATFWAAGWGAGLARKAMGRVHRHNGEADTTLQAFVASLVRYLVIVVGMVAVLQQLGVKTTSVLAVLGAASIAVGLALQGALGNVAAGVMLLLFRPYRVGDFVELSGGRQGTVKTLDLFVTELAAADNVKIVAPNGKIFGDFIVNYSTPAKRRVDVVFHVAPRQDLGAVLEAMRALMLADKRVLKDPPPLLEALSLNELFAEGAVRAWAKPSDYSAVKTTLVLAIQKLSIEQSQPAQPPEAVPTK
jgi:small conductance mechanosensitive channel